MSSGNWYRYNKKDTIEGRPFLDIYWLIKNSYILKGSNASGTLTWTSSHSKNSIGYSYDDNYKMITLNYNSNGLSIEEHFYLTKINTNFNSFRWAFQCRRCTRRVTKLYCNGGYFRCRHCHNLVHASSQSGYIDRLIKKSHKIEAKLGGDERYKKPKYMRWKKYEKLNDKLDRYDLLFAHTLASKYNFIV
jgi:hypothetical protein